LRFHSEVGGTTGRIDDQRRPVTGPAQGAPRLEGVQDCLCQGDLSPERRMHRILKEFVVQETAPSDCMKVRLPVDQNAVVARSHIAIDRLKVCEHALRVAVEIARRHVVLVGLVPSSALIEKPSEAKVRFCEAGLRSHEQAVLGDGCRRIFLFDAARGQNCAGKRLALRPRRRGWQVRAVGIVSHVISRRHDKNHK